jgi:hypothetical protein
MACAAIDAMAERMQRTGAPTEAIELVVVDDRDQIVRRPRTS